MATTNRDPRIGTALVTHNYDVTCAFCRKTIPAGTELAEDFVSCCLKCDRRIDGTSRKDDILATVGFLVFVLVMAFTFALFS